jgi:hypothetical protein
VRERGADHTIWAGKRGQDKRYTEVYGLITVLPAGGEGTPLHHVLIFSGMTSVGTQGAAEFFARPESLRVLREKRRRRDTRTFRRPTRWWCGAPATTLCCFPLSMPRTA